MEKNKGKSKKGVIIFSAVIIVMIGIICGIQYHNDQVKKERIAYIKKQEKLLDREVDKLKDLELDDKIYCKGGYAKVEKLLKKDEKYILDRRKTIKNQIAHLNAYPFFTLKNYEKEKPDFSESLNLIETSRNILIRANDELKDFLDEDSVYERYEDAKLTDKYKDLYYDKMYEMDFDMLYQQFEVDHNAAITILDKIERTIRLLKDYSDTWWIEGDSITSTSAEFIEQYNCEASGICN